MGKCEHGRIKYSCKECGGLGICEHRRIKSQCKECGGSRICEHGRMKAQCKDCGGSQICEHRRPKYRCKDCGGGGICEHGRLRAQCKECGGVRICEHGKQKSRCKECGGSGICEHGREKYSCKDCGGSSICKHGIVKYRCKECDGSSICIHKRLKFLCKDCGGSGICEHGKNKTICKECGGARICIHGKQKPHCKDCGGSKLCKSPHCSTKAIKKYDGYCMPCCIHLFPETPVARNYKTKETATVHAVQEAFPNFSWVSDKRVADGCSLRRPDLMVDMGTHLVIVEVDENQHTAYDSSCETKRLMQISQDVGHRPIVFIRFNPDSYTVKGVKVPSCWHANKLGIMVVVKKRAQEWEHRLARLKESIGHWVVQGTEKTVEIVELFYDET